MKGRSFQPETLDPSLSERIKLRELALGILAQSGTMTAQERARRERELEELRERYGMQRQNGNASGVLRRKKRLKYS